MIWKQLWDSKSTKLTSKHVLVTTSDPKIPCRNISQFVKSFPHRKTLNLPGVLSPSPDTSLAKLEIGEMGAYLRTRRTFFFWLWQNWRLCPAKLLRKSGEIGGCGYWKLSPKLPNYCWNRVWGQNWRLSPNPPNFWLSWYKVEIDYISSNPEPDWVWRNWRLSPNSPNFSFEWGNWRWGKLNIISQLAELLLGFGMLPSHVVRPLAWRLQNVPKCNRNNPNAKVINGGEPCFSCLACTASMGVQRNTLKRICKWGPTPVKVNM